MTWKAGVSDASSAFISPSERLPLSCALIAMATGPVNRDKRVQPGPREQTRRQVPVRSYHKGPLKGLKKGTKAGEQLKVLTREP